MERAEYFHPYRDSYMHLGVHLGRLSKSKSRSLLNILGIRV